MKRQRYWCGRSKLVLRSLQSGTLRVLLTFNFNRNNQCLESSNLKDIFDYEAENITTSFVLKENNTLWFFFQTAETIMKHNSSCSGLQMVCDPLLKEIVSDASSVCGYNFIHFTTVCKYAWVIRWLVFQSFGSAEGGRLQDVKEMAKAAGQSFPGFTPPDGETQEQVRLQYFINYTGVIHLCPIHLPFNNNSSMDTRTDIWNTFATTLYTQDISAGRFRKI